MNSPNYNHHCLLRHDPVTARAISRLSHGVARLTANLNPDRQYRHFRTRHAKSRNRTESESTAKDHQSIATGSKRKWQPDKIELDTIMELEHSTAVCLKPSMQSPPSSLLLSSSSSNMESLQHVSVSIDALNLQTKPIPTFSCSNPVLYKSLSSDHIETMGRYSSGSSMLSVTGSSGNNSESDASSHDADIEDADHGDLICFKGGRSLTRISRRKSSVIDKHSYELWRSMDTVYHASGGGGGGGDSSDGLSINIKIPRLTSIQLHNTTGLYCEHSSSRLSPAISPSCYQQTKRNNNSGMLASSSSDTNHCRRSRHNKRCKCRLRNKSDTTDDKHGEHICHKSCAKNGSHSSSSSSSLSTEESSDEKRSKGFIVYKHRFTSIPEHQNTCDTDMMNMTSRNKKTIQKIVKSPSTIMDNNRCETIVDPFKSKYPLNDSTLDEPVDPELANLLHGTWPLLSTRAKLGYTKAMNSSHSKRYPNSKKRNTPNNNHNNHHHKMKDDSKSIHQTSIKFIPSKLNQVDGQNDSILKTDKSNRQMPTPPWMISDNESLRDSDEFDSDHNKKLRTPGVNNQRPCVDNWKAEVSNAEPLTETNKGHRLLQKLGWKPGDKLGQNSKGLITPVNCKEDNHSFAI
ncbi:unnamed protein product [Schistosoma rodhaini]|uniref:G-patch domain-containing protein n=1 Tax=Schistosoma mansoni TaxID=6183 RepID=G4VE90_SCHMA|nr:hypothetical protein Smp_131680 [Schistosoma mansoni]CAH8501994.1 unnamed protein product [Schistosoma rodhaini]|eukprot:XP_018650655.1 hypothetical protein Smp_131680 [Schistosoma mansoni]